MLLASGSRSNAISEPVGSLIFREIWQERYLREVSYGSGGWKRRRRTHRPSRQVDRQILFLDILDEDGEDDLSRSCKKTGLVCSMQRPLTSLSDWYHSCLCA